jgi:hypothetical protein
MAKKGDDIAVKKTRYSNENTRVNLNFFDEKETDQLKIALLS